MKVETSSLVQNLSPEIPSILVIALFLILIGGLYFYSDTKIRKKERKIREKSEQKLPLDLRIGGVVNVEAIRDRLIANREYFEFKFPKSLKGYIHSVGEIEIDSETQVYNIYIVENIDDTKHLFFLKVEVSKGEISAVQLFIPYKTISPSISEWEEWLDGDEESSPKIGSKQFDLDGVEYSRVWKRGADEVVRTKYVENITEDREIYKDTMNISSLYSRKLPAGETEYLYLSNVEDFELHNYIKIELGLAISESELEVI